MFKQLGHIFKGDKVIWMVFLFLSLISIVEVFSASSELTYKGGSYWAPVMKHGGVLFVGLIGIIITCHIPCKYFRILTGFFLIVSFLSLLAVLIVGQSTNGAQRWISFLGVQFQPSEIAKGSMVLAAAQILSAMQTDKGADDHAFKYICVVGLALIGLIFFENLSTAVLLAVVVFMMMDIGRVSWKYLRVVAGGAITIVVLVLSAVMLIGQDESQLPNSQTQLTETLQPQDDKGIVDKVFHRASTWKTRIIKQVEGFKGSPNDVDLDKDAQRAHANIAIASSNVIGKGPGNSVERDFLSQAFSDFIYAIIIEEMGIVGAIFVALLYIILLFRTRYIANRCENSFPAFLAMGLALLLATQAVMNMWVAVGLAPVTGQPLPLVSKGGTSTIINCIYIGAILSVSRTAKKRDKVAADSASASPAPSA